MSVGPSPPTTAPHNPRRSTRKVSPTGHIVRLRGDLLQHTTCACGRPSGDDAYVCTHCANQTRTALRQIVDGLDTDLTTTMAKQGTRPTTQSGGRPGKKSEAPLPLDLRAAEARTILTGTLRAWVTRIREDMPRSTRPRDTMPAMAAWLLPLTGWLRHATYGPQALDELTAAVQQALRVVDTPEERVGVGRCPTCSSPVYAPASRLTAYYKTEDCEGTVDVQQWRRSLEDLAWSHEAGATEIAAFATKHLGWKLAASTIRKWASDGKISPTNPGERIPRYRFELVAKLAGKDTVEKIAC